MFDPGTSLLKWWRTASPRSRWVAGIGLFSLLATGILIVISGSPATGETYSSPDAGSTTWALLGVFVKLLVVIGLFVGSVIIFRYYSSKRPFRNASRQLEVVETIRLSPRQSLHLIRAGDRLLIVGATDQAISLVSEMVAKLDENDKTAEEIPAAPQKETFQNILASLNSIAK